MSQPRPTDPIGSIGWAERTGGVLTTRECLALARPLLPPDSSLARDAEVAAQDLLTPVLLNHSSRAYEKSLTTLPDWRIACNFVGKGHRRHGVATAALDGALDLIARLGGGKV